MSENWVKKLEQALLKMPSRSRISKARQRGDTSLEERAIAREIIERALELEIELEKQVDEIMSRSSDLSCLNCKSEVTWASQKRPQDAPVLQTGEEWGRAGRSVV